jgi:CubicO group peptidase (beta-lactamase class C family)
MRIPNMLALKERTCGGATICGAVEPGFEAVRDAFEENFTSRGDLGSATAVYVDGRPVVDLWGGTADHVNGRPWTSDTLSLVWSATKGPAAMAVHLLAQRGLIDLDAPVARYWPEFAQNGKADIPVHMILSHRAGLPVIDRKVGRQDLLDGKAVVEALAAQAPVWKPGTRHGYHAITIGYLTGELVRRVTGRTLGRYFADEIAVPLGLDFWIGLPKDHLHRVSRIIEAEASEPGIVDTLPEGEIRDTAKAYGKSVADPNSLTSRAFHIGGFRNSDFNQPDVQAAELAWGNGIGDARSLARLYAATIGEVDGFRLLSEETLKRATIDRGAAPDAVLVYPTRWSDGFMLPTRIAPWLSESSFGFTGAGGHVGLADPELKVGFAYTMTKMFGNLTGDPRPAALLEALKASLK